MSTRLPLVLVLGATGRTGQSIVQGLLASRNFHVAALVRPASLSKPATNALRASGIDVRTGDLHDGTEKLTKAMSGVDILISAVSTEMVPSQKDAIRAAQAAGVKRVIPCDFGPLGERGVVAAHDQKLAIQDFIKELGVPYTFIDVGWWMQLALPLPERSAFIMKALTYEIYNNGGAKMLLTARDHIGTYVARIIADSRTLNNAVIIWEDERTQLEQHEIGERASGEGDALEAKRIYVTAEELKQRHATAKAEHEKDPTNVLAYMNKSWSEYMLSMHVLHENTLENAKRLGYLDARELYPDMPKYTLEEFAEEFYSLPDPGPVCG
ncbi:NAD-P-binding protein [Trametes coccinea BRFM310]|uniref:NAD-P-binding protein n=1 Tax=Trametes coccinea (strain BRFM310) TaxID=1353009 RepID=A0A1Y2IE65_TRAC3|nr:NAD-P-binding protein [Trametes coccinea BRFM310]